MVIVRALCGKDQEYINSRLRPNKRKFPTGRIPGAQLKMTSYGQYRLRSYQPMNRYQYDTYFNFDLWRSVPNFSVPRLGRTVRITDTKGEPIILGKRRIRSKKFRIQYEKHTFSDQLTYSFKIFDQCMELLEQVPKSLPLMYLYKKFLDKF